MSSHTFDITGGHCNGSKKRPATGSSGPAARAKQSKPAAPIAGPATQVPLELQAFQAQVRYQYSLQDVYQSGHTLRQELLPKQRRDRCNAVDKFFKENICPATWWIKPTISVKYTPFEGTKQRDLIERLYQEKSLWSSIKEPCSTYRELSEFANNTAQSLEFKTKLQAAMQATAIDNTADENPWMPNGPGVVPTQQECTQVAALLGYCAMTRAMNGWVNGQPPEGVSKDDANNLYIDFAVKTPKGPITDAYVIEDLIVALKEGEARVQRMFDCIFNGDKKRNLEYPSEEMVKKIDTAPAPIQFKDKDHDKLIHMVRMIQKTQEVQMDLFSKWERSTMKKVNGRYQPVNVHDPDVAFCTPFSDACATINNPEPLAEQQEPSSPQMLQSSQAPQTPQTPLHANAPISAQFPNLAKGAHAGTPATGGPSI